MSIFSDFLLLCVCKYY